MVVTVKGRDYSVFFHYATGEPCTVMAHKKHSQTQRIGIHGPTARAAIAAAAHGVPSVSNDQKGGA